MPGIQQRSHTEELTSLRVRVAELEGELRQRDLSAAALDESRSLFDTFLSNIPALAWMKDEFGRYVYGNRAFVDMMERTGVTCLGSTDAELWPPELAARFQEFDRRASAGALQAASDILPLPEGDRHFRILRFPFHAGSGRLYIGGIAMDETNGVQLRSVQNRCESYFHSGITGVMECDGDRIVEANEVLLRWLGISREELETERISWRSLTPESYRSQDDAALADLLTEGSCRPYEKELLNARRQPVPVLVSMSSLGMGGTRFICFVLDISDRKQMEARLLRSQKLESLGLIAGGVAHDFNNLLATIMGNASLSSDAISREHPAFQSLNEVIIASRRASDLTHQVLAYSGRANFHVRPLNLSDSVREIGSLLETTISKKISLRFELAGNLPMIEGDEGQLQQVIMNLVINASDAIGEQPGEITVVTRASGRNVCFEVRDTGCGMSEETRARIFDPFFTTKTDGRGLGLAAVLGIVRGHRGALTVESAPGAGTTFRVVFPATAAQPLQQAPASAREDLRGSETILIVDDDEGIRRMTRVALERLGYRVLAAADGAEGVRTFAAHCDEIAAVILDWAMPVMNGDEALARIMDIDPDARVLMSSGYAETETLQKVSSRHLAGFVQKPYTTAKLAELLREIIVCNRSSSEIRAAR